MSLVGGHQVLQTVFILAPPRMGWQQVGHPCLLQLGRSSFRSVDALAHLHLSTFTAGSTSHMEHPPILPAFLCVI